MNPMTNKSNIPSCLSEADVEFMLANPGQTIASGGKPPEVIQAQRSVDVSQPSRKGIRPNIAGNNADHTGERIKVSPSLAKKLDEGDKKLRAEAKEQLQQIRAAEENADPSNINSRISYLERQLKKAMTEINRLKKEGNDAAS